MLGSQSTFSVRAKESKTVAISDIDENLFRLNSYWDLTEHAKAS